MGSKANGAGSMVAAMAGASVGVAALLMSHAALWAALARREGVAGGREVALALAVVAGVVVVATSAAALVASRGRAEVGPAGVAFRPLVGPARFLAWDQVTRVRCGRRGTIRLAGRDTSVRVDLRAMSSANQSDAAALLRSRLGWRFNLPAKLPGRPAADAARRDAR